jgi:hypothetical protein
LSHPLAQRRIFGQPPQRRRHTVRVCGVDEKSAHAVLDELGDARERGGHDGTARGHRFHQRHRDAVHLAVVGDDAGQHEDVAFAHQPGHLVLRPRAEQMNAL